MRIERRKLGTRVRVILNRHEAREACIQVLEKAGRFIRGIVARSSSMYVGSSSTEEIQGIGFYVDAIDFEKACRNVALKRTELPDDCSFRIGLDSNGNISGATFQFYTGIETEIV